MFFYHFAFELCTIYGPESSRYKIFSFKHMDTGFQLINLKSLVFINCFIAFPLFYSNNKSVLCFLIIVFIFFSCSAIKWSSALEIVDYWRHMMWGISPLSASHTLLVLFFTFDWSSVFLFANPSSTNNL